MAIANIVGVWCQSQIATVASAPVAIWDWLRAWAAPVAASVGITWEVLAWIAFYGLVAGVVVDGTEMIARSRHAIQALIVNLFMIIMFEVGFGAPEVYHADSAHYPTRFIAIGLFSVYFISIALGMVAMRATRRRWPASRWPIYGGAKGYAVRRQETPHDTP